MHTAPLSVSVAALTLFAALAGGPAAAQAPKMFEGADLALGAKLLADNQCNACHARNVGGDGTGIYKRPGSKITTPQALRTMVEFCGTQLRLSLFPDEVNAIAAVLNRDFYKFKESGK